MLGLLFIGGSYASTRLWHGKTANPFNTREAEEGLGQLAMTLVPGTVALGGLLVASAGILLLPNARGITRVIVIVMLGLAIAIFLLGFLAGVSLLFTGRPRALVPPHLRNRGGTRVNPTALPPTRHRRSSR